MRSLADQYTKFIDYYFGNRPNIRSASAYLRSYPELLDVHIGELSAAINLVQRFKNTDDLRFRYPGLFINAEYLTRILENEELPFWQEIEQKLVADNPEDRSGELHLTLEELEQFEFIDRMTLPVQLLGALFVAFYRTYTLVTRPPLRSRGAQVASTIEEMLALLALNDCKTQLFDAVKHWVLDYEEEGFSQELAEKVAALSSNR